MITRCTVHSRMRLTSATIPSGVFATLNASAGVSLNPSSTALETSMPTTVEESVTEASLPCLCELAPVVAIRPRLRWLFGLNPRRRRRSHFVTACEGPERIDLSPPAAARAAPLRFAARTATERIGVEIEGGWDIVGFRNIQGAHLRHAQTWPTWP